MTETSYCCPAGYAGNPGYVLEEIQGSSSGDKTKVEYCDDDLKGFLLDVRKSGGKTYYLRLVTSEGKRKYHRIADASILPLEEAKGKALKLKRSIEEGKEVVLDTPPTDYSSITLNQFYHEYYLPFIQKHVKSWKSNDSMMRIHILPLFGKHKMSDIKNMRL